MFNRGTLTLILCSSLADISNIAIPTSLKLGSQATSDQSAMHMCMIYLSIIAIFQPVSQVDDKDFTDSLVPGPRWGPDCLKKLTRYVDLWRCDKCGQDNRDSLC